MEKFTNQTENLNEKAVKIGSSVPSDGAVLGWFNSEDINPGNSISVVDVSNLIDENNVQKIDISEPILVYADELGFLKTSDNKYSFPTNNLTIGNIFIGKPTNTEQIDESTLNSKDFVHYYYVSKHFISAPAAFSLLSRRQYLDASRLNGINIKVIYENGKEYIDPNTNAKKYRILLEPFVTDFNVNNPEKPHRVIVLLDHDKPNNLSLIYDKIETNPDGEIFNQQIQYSETINAVSYFSEVPEESFVIDDNYYQENNYSIKKINEKYSDLFSTNISDTGYQVVVPTKAISDYRVFEVFNWRLIGRSRVSISRDEVNYNSPSEVDGHSLTQSIKVGVLHADNEVNENINPYVFLRLNYSPFNLSKYNFYNPIYNGPADSTNANYWKVNIDTIGTLNDFDVLIWSPKSTITVNQKAKIDAFVGNNGTIILDLSASTADASNIDERLVIDRAGLASSYIDTLNDSVVIDYRKNGGWTILDDSNNSIFEKSYYGIFGANYIPSRNTYKTYPFFSSNGSAEVFCKAGPTSAAAKPIGIVIQYPNSGDSLSKGNIIATTFPLAQYCNSIYNAGSPEQSISNFGEISNDIGISLTYSGIVEGPFKFLYNCVSYALYCQRATGVQDIRSTLFNFVAPWDSSWAMHGDAILEDEKRNYFTKVSISSSSELYTRDILGSQASAFEYYKYYLSRNLPELQRSILSSLLPSEVEIYIEVTNPDIILTNAEKVDENDFLIEENIPSSYTLYKIINNSAKTFAYSDPAKISPKLIAPTKMGPYVIRDKPISSSSTRRFNNELNILNSFKNYPFNLTSSYNYFQGRDKPQVLDATYTTELDVYLEGKMDVEILIRPGIPAIDPVPSREIPGVTGLCNDFKSSIDDLNQLRSTQVTANSNIFPYTGDIDIHKVLDMWEYKTVTSPFMMATIPSGTSIPIESRSIAEIESVSTFSLFENQTGAISIQSTSVPGQHEPGPVAQDALERSRLWEIFKKGAAASGLYLQNVAYSSYRMHSAYIDNSGYLIIRQLVINPVGSYYISDRKAYRRRNFETETPLQYVSALANMANASGRSNAIATIFDAKQRVGGTFLAAKIMSTTLKMQTGSVSNFLNMYKDGSTVTVIPRQFIPGEDYSPGYWQKERREYTLQAPWANANALKFYEKYGPINWKQGAVEDFSPNPYNNTYSDAVLYTSLYGSETVNVQRMYEWARTINNYKESPWFLTLVTRDNFDRVTLPVIDVWGNPTGTYINPPTSTPGNPVTPTPPAPVVPAPTPTVPGRTPPSSGGGSSGGGSSGGGSSGGGSSGGGSSGGGSSGGGSSGGGSSGGGSSGGATRPGGGSSSGGSSGTGSRPGSASTSSPILQRSSYVEYIQTVLKTHGYYSSTIDGIYGPVTKSAVLKFQDKYGQRWEDGKVDSETKWYLAFYVRVIQLFEPQKYNTMYTEAGAEVKKYIDAVNQMALCSEINKPGKVYKKITFSGFAGPSEGADVIWFKLPDDLVKVQTITIVADQGPNGWKNYHITSYGYSSSYTTDYSQTTVFHGLNLSASSGQIDINLANIEASKARYFWVRIVGGAIPGFGFAEGFSISQIKAKGSIMSASIPGTPAVPPVTQRYTTDTLPVYARLVIPETARGISTANPHSETYSTPRVLEKRNAAYIKHIYWNDPTVLSGRVSKTFQDNEQKLGDSDERTFGNLKITFSQSLRRIEYLYHCTLNSITSGNTSYPVSGNPPVTLTTNAELKKIDIDTSSTYYSVDDVVYVDQNVDNYRMKKINGTILPDTRNFVNVNDGILLLCNNDGQPYGVLTAAQILTQIAGTQVLTDEEVDFRYGFFYLKNNTTDENGFIYGFYDVLQREFIGKKIHYIDYLNRGPSNIFIAVCAFDADGNTQNKNEYIGPTVSTTFKPVVLPLKMICPVYSVKYNNLSSIKIGEIDPKISKFDSWELPVTTGSFWKTISISSSTMWSDWKNKYKGQNLLAYYSTLDKISMDWSDIYGYGYYDIVDETPILLTSKKIQVKRVPILSWNFPTNNSDSKFHIIKNIIEIYIRNSINEEWEKISHTQIKDIDCQNGTIEFLNPIVPSDLNLIKVSYTTSNKDILIRQVDGTPVPLNPFLNYDSIKFDRPLFVYITPKRIYKRSDPLNDSSNLVKVSDYSYDSFVNFTYNKEIFNYLSTEYDPFALPIGMVYVYNNPYRKTTQVADLRLRGGGLINDINIIELQDTINDVQSLWDIYPPQGTTYPKGGYVIVKIPQEVKDNFVQIEEIDRIVQNNLTAGVVYEIQDMNGNAWV